MADRTAREAAVETMTDARERLVEAGRGPLLGNVAHGDSTHFSRRALDAFLARPDDLIALLVERGALEAIMGTPPGEPGIYEYGRVRSDTET